MNIADIEDLYSEGLLTDHERETLKTSAAQPLLSVFWELRTLLYLGVLLLAGGLGVLVYKNIDTIGHQIIIATIGIICVACFAYCIKKSSGYSDKKVESPGVFYDYILLLGCLLLITFLAYWQYAYHIFGNRLGMATFIPMVILFVSAYYFDHLGVLSLAVTNLAAWLGITVTPLQLLSANDFDDTRLIYTGIALGIVLIAAGIVSYQKNVKAHFAFTYKNFGVHLTLVSLLAAMFHFDNIYLLIFLVIMATCYYFFRMALKEKSFYFIAITLLYAYVALSSVIVMLMITTHFDAFILLAFYFVASAVGLILALIHYNKILKQ
ncbi:MAG: DUF2157 domain-containing protein [Chitinophagaceae bacterium]|jgi:hypothetical protein|nr:DUF2157 domain-containing protein [Chitinophagaceae bacterium]